MMSFNAGVSGGSCEFPSRLTLQIWTSTSVRSRSRSPRWFKVGDFSYSAMSRAVT